MDWLDSHLLTTIVFLPLVWGLIGLMLPVGTEGGKSTLRYWTLAGSLVTFAISILLYTNFQTNGAEFQFTENAAWIPSLGITYNLGIDGISLWLVLLTTFIMPIAIL